MSDSGSDIAAQSVEWHPKWEANFAPAERKFPRVLMENPGQMHITIDCTGQMKVSSEQNYFNSL
jgi:hypothetical protein